ncbi:mucoidy inhibitor MuiA family protein [Emticicia sp. ODNR4P]|nr:mucoidy inhibitor MuiA family protein [Emticicia sp. ODNR4P]
MIKVLFIFLHGLWFTPMLFNQPISSRIEAVTVYPDGAQITRKAKVDLPVGKTEILFSGLGATLDAKSLQISVDTRVKVLEVNHRLKDIKKEEQEEIKKHEDQKTAIDAKIKNFRAMLTVYKREEELLVKNQTIGTASTAKVEELKLLVDFQRQRMTEVLNKQLEIERNIQAFEDEKKKHDQALTELTEKQTANTSEVLVTVETKEALPDVTFNISYYVKEAGWIPTYDVRVENVLKPLKLAYKAYVYQYSGEDWRAVKLRFSTANPKKNATPPELQKWFWGEANDYSSYYNAVESNLTGLTEVKGSVKDFATQNGLPAVSISFAGTNFGTATDANGNYRLAIPPNLQKKGLELIYSYIGYKTQRQRVYGNKLDILLQADHNELNEVVVAGYGRQQKQTLTVGIATVERKSKDAPAITNIEESEAPTSLSFDVISPTTIPSDAETHTIDLKEEDIPTLYEYKVIPKIDTDVFLQAKVVDWEKYNLVDGDVNLYLEGTYVGKSDLTLKQNDTLTFALGRDKNIIVTRKKQKELQKKQFLSNSKVDHVSYEIELKNTKKYPINIMVEDQFPVTRLKEIEIYDKLAPEAGVDNDSGKITWRLNLAAMQQKKLTFQYSVKSPKGTNNSTE